MTQALMDIVLGQMFFLASAEAGEVNEASAERELGGMVRVLETRLTGEEKGAFLAAVAARLERARAFVGEGTEREPARAHFLTHLPETIGLVGE